MRREIFRDLKTDSFIGPGDQGDGFILHSNTPPFFLVSTATFVIRPLAGTLTSGQLSLNWVDVSTSEHFTTFKLTRQLCYNVPMDKNELNEEEMRIWNMWKGSFKRIFGRVVKDMSENTGLSEGDFGVLDRLVQFGNGKLRQQELADLMDWDKSRLSHHLTRMEKRGLVLRKPLDRERGVEVIITPGGKSALDEALPIVSKAIRKHFLDQLTDQDIESITTLAERTKTRSSSSCKET
ncbi:MarR family winged helix-turn-helix transcriptional regulator [Paenibacillus piri]|nr:MarR family transcriptional regulator [Paenibacillus piri]